jgi:hypothetical protein
MSHRHERPRRRSRARAGAVLVEGVIVAASLVILFACMMVVHGYSSLHLSKLDEARAEAWKNSVSGCGADAAPDPASLASGLVHGDDNPIIPDGFVPSSRDASREFSTQGIFNADGHREVRFLCNPKPTTKTMNESVAWVFDIFK